MGLTTRGFGGNVLGSVTATAGTITNHLVPPNRQGIARVSTVRVTAAGTAHTLTALRSLGTTTASAAAATGQAVVVFTAQPQAGNSVAANDWVAIRHAADGITRLYRVSSVSGLNITMTANLTVAVTAGDKIWFFGVAGDTDPRTGTVHPTLPIPANATTTYQDTITGVATGHAVDEPVLLQSDNGTAAGSLTQTVYTYTTE